jgi:cob(I)alamin adenosyltransferase
MKRKRSLRITKVYTRAGDAGRTRLAGGQAVWKDDLRVEAYGTVDELNAAIGAVLALADSRPINKRTRARLDVDLRRVQNKLFDIGGLLATAPGQQFPNMPRVTEQDIVRLEQLMDACQKELPPLKEFLLPGGGIVPSLLHQTRTICRRAERVCVRLARQEPVDPQIVSYLNRLSDALFVLARWVTVRNKAPELLWQRNLE